MLCLTNTREILINNGTITDEAYSTPVDLWSLGCITVILLAGEVLFADRNHPTYEQNPRHFVTTLASKCDLSILDNQDHHIWGCVGSNPKDFIKRLLVLNEGLRMTATEALGHAWFSHSYYADDFDALYKRSICDWRPQRKVYRPVEHIQDSSSDLETTSQSRKLMCENLVSQFFSQPSRQVPDDCNSLEGFAASQHCQATTPPRPTVEEYADTHGDYPSQFEQRLHNTSETGYFESEFEQHLSDADESGYPQHSTRTLHHDSIDNSICQLTLDSEAVKTFTADGDSVDEDVECYGYDEDICEAMYELDE
jgi:pheromone a factor receptor